MGEVRHGSAVYCSVDDVRRYFRKEGAFGTDTNPSDADVLDFIRGASAEIDEHTRNSWRNNQVLNETHDFSTSYRWDAGRPVMLNKPHIRTPLDSTQGDKLEIWEGNNWHDWVADDSLSEGREGDYWVDPSTGHLYVYMRFTWHSRPQIRVSYRYGKDRGTTTKTLDDGQTTYDVIDGPHDIKRACAKLTARDLVSSDQHSQLVPGGEGSPSPEKAMDDWERDVFGGQDKKGLLERHKVDPAWVEPF